MFANHEYGVQDIVGKMKNVYRRGSQIVTDGVQFAINESPTARLVYDLIVGGFLDSVSIGTQGPYPDDDDVYRNHSLMEVSWVGLPNNKNATINDATKLLDIAAKNGLDLSKYDKEEKSNMSLIKIKNERDFAVALKYKNEADEEVEATVEAGAEVEVPEAEKETVEKQLADAEAPEEVEEEEEKEEDVQNSFSKEDLDLIANVKNELAELRKFKDEHSADKAEEPQFDKDGKVINKGTTTVSATQKQESELTKKLKAMNGADRLQRAAELAFKNQLWSPEYAAINEVNIAELKEKASNFEKLGKEGEALAKNVVTMADDSFGGLVPSYELLSEIVGVRTSYDELLSVFTFQPIDRLQYAWNLRVGDIDMQPVEFCDDDEDGNLKPISEYGLNQETRNLEELAAVTPVCNAATLFAVGDLLGDIAEGYRNDQRRKFAQLVVAEFEKAVETRVAGKSTGGAAIAADPDGSLEASNGIEWKAILQAITSLTANDPNGVLIFSSATYAVIQAAAIAQGIAGGGKVELYMENGASYSQLFGHRVVIVPNDLMPTLGTSETRTIVVNGQTVTVNHAIFYTRSNNWRGVTHSSGLQYDLSRDASYEVNTGTSQSPVWRTRSAYQRNELVLRGSFFRGGGVKDFREVAGILAQTVPAES
jgi:hypothetical protein